MSEHEVPQRLLDDLKSNVVDRAGLKEAVFMSIADELSLLGTCDRKKVGAVIVRDGRCISWGFNGAPHGLEHCSENGHGWGTVDRSGQIPIKDLSDQAVEKLKEQPRQEILPWDWQGAVDLLAEKYGCRNATHAEANALAFAARQGISTDGATLFVTVSPCDVCARLLIAAGIVRVVYSEEYRLKDGVNLLREAGVEVG